MKLPSVTRGIRHLPATLMWITILSAILYPLVQADYPPGADMLNHVARVHVLYNLPNDPALQKYYQADWGIIPNLAFDLFSVPLLNVMSAAMAGKLFIGLTLLLMFAGVSALRYILFGRVGLLPLCVGLVAYSAPIALGFANFSFGIGLMLLMLAGWLALSRQKYQLRFAVGTCFSLILFFTHLIVFGLYTAVLVSVRANELLRGGKWNLRTESLIVGPLLLPACLWFWVKPSAMGTQTVFGSFAGRLEALMSPVMYFNNFDIAVAISLLVIIAWLLSSQRARINPVLLIAIIMLTVIALLMPVRLFGVWLTHIRLPLVVALLFIAAVEIRIPERKLRGLIVLALLTIGGFRLDKVTHSINLCDDKRQQFSRAMAVIETGARLLPVIEPDSTTGDCLFSGYWHLPAIAVIDKSTFNPMMFVHLQPLAFRPEYRPLIQKVAQPASPGLLAGEPFAPGEPRWNAVIAAKWREKFDYLIWLHPGTSPKRVPLDLQFLSRSDFFTIYKIPGK